MRTVIELGRDGTRTIFHRRGDMAWTHAPGMRYRYWSVSWSKWIDVDCPCSVSEVPHADGDHGGGDASGVPGTPEAARAGWKVPLRGAAP